MLTGSDPGTRKRFARIVGWGKALPERCVTNEELSERVDTSGDWILTRTGIRQRYVASEQETASSLAVLASRRALEACGLAPERLDLVICATCTGDQIFPATASLVQGQLGAGRAGAFDVNAACNGFICALATAVQFVETGVYETVLVVGSEVYSRILDWSDRQTCVLFGDGAGAVVVTAHAATGVRAVMLGSDGSGAQALYVPGPCGPPAQGRSPYHLKMNGRTVFGFAVRRLSQSIRAVCEQAGFSLAEVHSFVLHQANVRILQGVASALGVPMERFFVNLDRYGNTSAASIPLAIDEAVGAGVLVPDRKVVLAAVGGGLSWGAIALEW